MRLKLKKDLSELVRGSVEETLNALLDAQISFAKPFTKRNEDY
ncbi:hypothetical protein LEP1GSC080_1063 [Leptospira interrogans str. FPW2026]|nr:hypothetical protein LEP1GSC080_1063 [Leptospira interrogans str. FPW2026]